MNASLPPTLALAMTSMAPPQSVVHQIVNEEAALRADLHRNHLKNSGELDRRNHAQALRLQQAHQDATRGRL